ncbi:hypothetical protein ACFLWR_00525 [Chloroflexota bacterium]
MDINWTEWYSIKDKQAINSIPEKPGVYQIQTDIEFNRLNGSSDIVYIGRARPSLKERLARTKLNDFTQLDRSNKWLLANNKALKFRYAVLESNEEAEYTEAILLWDYENTHWELPPGNDQLAKTPIMRKLNEVIPGFNRNTLKELIRKYKTSTAIADAFDIPKVIIDNYLVYECLTLGS